MHRSTRPAPFPRAGFTLVELAIVLVIMGLIIGGVIAGNALIDSSKIRSLLNDVNKYRAAVSSFQTKYGSYPGDMRGTEVVSFWPGEQTLYGSVAAAGGNGNGRICAFSGEDENFKAWRQLALAGMIEGTYTGTHSSFRGVVDVNMPPAAIEGMGIMYNCLDPAHGNYWVLEIEFPVLAQQRPIWLFTLGRVEFAAHDGTWVVTSGRALTPRQAQEIDVKGDDGFPTSGQIHGGVLDASCATNTTPGGAYTISHRSGICRLSFVP